LYHLGRYRSTEPPFEANKTRAIVREDVLESKERLADDIRGLLGACASAVGGRYACVLDPKSVLFENAEPEGGQWVLRQYLEKRAGRLFEIPKAMAAGTELEDAFADWESPAGEPPDEFLLAFINGRVALVAVCPNAEEAQGLVMRPLRALADRLFRLNAAWRLDEKGRGLFLSRPRLDLVAVGRPRD
jgi:hypothetical protein